MTDEERVALALAALAEVADPATVGPLVDAAAPAPGVIDLRFAAEVAGYTGWIWVVSTSDLDGVDPTVLELQLLPGDGALVAPPWVPWEERLAEWRRTHGDADAHPDDEDESDEDEDDSDEDDDEELDAEIDELLDDGDVDGIEVDELEGAAAPDRSEREGGRRS